MEALRIQSKLSASSESVATNVTRAEHQTDRRAAALPFENSRSESADLTKHKDHLPIQGPGVPPIAATRIYELLDAAKR